MMQQVRLVRIVRGLKAYQLAGMLGYNPQYWLQVEKGLREPPAEVARKASIILGLPRDELFRPADGVLANKV